VQLDEKWSFVAKKEKQVEPDNPADQDKGDDWDHTAVDAEHRLLLAVVPGKRTAATCKRLVAEVQKRTRGRTDVLLTSDAYGSYATAIEEAYGTAESQPQQSSSGGSATAQRVLPPEMCYATVCKTREKGRVVEVIRSLVFGVAGVLAWLLSRSQVSKTVNTSLVERHNGTDRRQNARKHRKTYGFSKRLALHHAATYFIGYSYNFCWVVRTLASNDETGRKQARTPAMAAGLADHVWSVEKWLTYPAKPC
jgi:IS1 family transposase